MNKTKQKGCDTKISQKCPTWAALAELANEVGLSNQFEQKEVDGTCPFSDLCDQCFGYRHCLIKMAYEESKSKKCKCS